MQPTHIIVPNHKYFNEKVTLFADVDDMSPVEIYMPDRPNFSKVCNYNRPTSNQKWERIEAPKSFARFRNMSKEQIYASLTKDEHEFILRQYYYREHGYWFFNNGSLTYLTGTNWMYLNWWKIDIGYPKFIYEDSKYFWHWWKCCNDPDSAGMLDLEARRFGKSYRAGVIIYNETFTERDCMSGIQSKTDEDAEKMFQKTVVKPWKRLPFFWQPIFDSSNNPRSELRFYSPTTRGTQSREELASEQALGSQIEVRSATDIAFDGEKLKRSVDDEAGKIEKYSIVNRWAIKKHCLTDSTQAGKIIGKGLVTSTVGEMSRGGGNEFKEIWDLSDESKKQGGRTTTWLNRHYRPAHEGYIVDEFGRTKKEEALAAIQKLFNSAKGKPFELASLKRQFPRTLKEAFKSSAAECRFNIEIIDSRLEEFTFKNPHLTYGDFQWKDNQKDTEVIFVPKDKRIAKFVVSYLFEDPKQSNKKYSKNNMWWPDNFTFGTAGSDPFRYDEATSNKKSRGTGSAFREHNALIDPPSKDVGMWQTNRFICTYANRPGKYEYGEDMLMMCVYYGIPMFPEMNITFIMDYFKERGYGGFLLYPKGSDFRWSRVPGANTNDKTKDNIFTEVDNYIDHHGQREVHTEILEACRDVDYNDLQPADLFVAAGYALLGAKNKRTAYSNPSGQQSVSDPLFETYS